jgi:DNA-binding transcriptional regulator PaaX
MRDIFRSILRTLGYQELQLSVWISKNKVEKETEEVIREYDLWRYVRLLVIEEVHV